MESFAATKGQISIFHEVSWSPAFPKSIFHMSNLHKVIWRWRNHGKISLRRGVGVVKTMGGRLILALRKQHVGLVPWTAGTILGAAETPLTRAANWVD